MKTPKVFKDNLKNETITGDMLAVCIYSVNKRAKNCRDNIRNFYCAREYNPYFTDKYDTVEKNTLKELEYYGMKDKMLSLLKPECIHKNSFGEYFLFYEISDYSFHSPIYSYTSEDYPGLTVIDIGKLTTYGHEINDLISVQFVKKVIALIDSGKYKFEGGSYYDN